MTPCAWCKDRGRKRKPCPMCGLLVLNDSALAQMVGSLWVGVDVPSQPKKTKKAKRQ